MGSIFFKKNFFLSQICNGNLFIVVTGMIQSVQSYGGSIYWKHTYFL